MDHLWAFQPFKNWSDGSTFLVEVWPGNFFQNDSEMKCRRILLSGIRQRAFLCDENENLASGEFIDFSEL